MKKTLFYFFTLVLFTTKAQVSFVKGYIVDEKGDTIKGEVKINPKKEQDNYSKVFFKDEAGTQKSYKPNKVKAYGFNNQNFVALDFDGELKYFKVLASGEVSLYKILTEVVVMNSVSYEPEYFICRQENKKLISVKEGRFKKQLQDIMSGASGYANEYKDDKKLNEEKAIEVISNYNSRKSNN